ncbi:hypothetical protein Leryth_015397, partial [Lithospermum erythrorhizon]
VKSTKGQNSTTKVLELDNRNTNTKHVNSTKDRTLPQRSSSSATKTRTLSMSSPQRTELYHKGPRVRQQRHEH